MESLHDFTIIPCSIDPDDDYQYEINRVLKRVWALSGNPAASCPLRYKSHLMVDVPGTQGSQCRVWLTLAENSVIDFFEACTQWCRVLFDGLHRQGGDLNSDYWAIRLTPAGVLGFEVSVETSFGESWFSHFIRRLFSLSGLGMLQTIQQ